MSCLASSSEQLRRVRAPRTWRRWRVVILLAWIGTAALAKPPRAFRDPSIDLSRLRTFSVVLGTPWGNPECERRTLDAVRNRVAQRGWATTDDAAADLVVVVHGGIVDRTGVHRYPSPRNPKGAHHHRPDRTHTYTYKERTLIVELQERVTGRIAWRAEVPGVVASDFEREHARIERRLDRLLASFPRRTLPA